MTSYFHCSNFPMSSSTHFTQVFSRSSTLFSQVRSSSRIH
nr:MAG TPA: hypothetical protein [Caudoviricetes sp.]